MTKTHKYANIFNIRLYQKLFQEMLEQHKDLFANFKNIHDKFAVSPETHKLEFNRLGSQILDIIRRYERRLCGSTERSTFSKFSANLSDKFWSGIRAVFPKIDFVGIK